MNVLCWIILLQGSLIHFNYMRNSQSSEDNFSDGKKVRTHASTTNTFLLSLSLHYFLHEFLKSHTGITETYSISNAHHFSSAVIIYMFLLSFHTVLEMLILFSIHSYSIMIQFKKSLLFYPEAQNR